MNGIMIKVLSKEDAAYELSLNPEKWDNVISIGSYSDTIPVEFTNFKGRKLRLVFDDVEIGNEVCEPATIKDISTLISFCEDLEGHVLIHCAAGVSRSPACCLIAYATILGRGNENMALELMEQSCYEGIYPNARIVYFGDRLLGFNENLWKVYYEKYLSKYKTKDGSNFLLEYLRKFYKNNIMELN